MGRSGLGRARRADRFPAGPVPVERMIDHYKQPPFLPFFPHSGGAAAGMRAVTMPACPAGAVVSELPGGNRQLLTPPNARPPPLAAAVRWGISRMNPACSWPVTIDPGRG